MSAEEKDRYQKRKKKLEKFEKSLICKKKKLIVKILINKNRKDFLEIQISIQLSWLYRP